MSKITFFILLATLFGIQTNYWNLGLSITDKSKRVIKKDIQINDIVAENSNILNTNKTRIPIIVYIICSEM